MANLRQLRRRIKSIQNIHGVTRAMEMVSASRLRRAQTRLEMIRPYVTHLLGMVGRLVKDVPSSLHPLLQARPVSAFGLVVLTGERGLCGAYHEKILMQASAVLHRAEVPVKVYAIGRRGIDHFRRHGQSVERSWMGIGVGTDRATIQEISSTLQEAFVQGEVDAIHVIQTRWARGAYRVIETAWLPLTVASVASEVSETTSASGPWLRPPHLTEPAAPQLLKTLLPLASDLQFYRMVFESLEAEHGARMMAMRLATDNAGEMMDHLTLLRNKVRQAVITKELTEIMGGAEALKG